MSGGNGGYTKRLRRADADWVGDYEITDRKDRAKGRVWIENRPTGDAVGAINKVLRSLGPGGLVKQGRREERAVEGADVDGAGHTSGGHGSSEEEMKASRNSR
jgi:hypothetical protein